MNTIGGKQVAYATLADIAKRVNKSIATVSKVLNGSGGDIRVGNETRRKILEAAKELNYRPNYIARHLVKKGTRVIGLLIPDIMQSFFNEITYHLSERLDRAGFDLLLAHSYENPIPERREIETILSRRVDGIVVAPAKGRGNLGLFHEISKSGIPLVLMDRYFPGENFLSVTTDDRNGSFSLFHHMVERGAKRIAFVCGELDTSVTIERISGYRRAMELSGNGVDDNLLIESGYFQEDGYRVAKGLIENGKIKKLDGIAGVNDSVALGILEAIWEAGIRVPEDILVAGYGDERFSRYLRVPLTSVYQPTERIADETFHLLMRLINREKVEGLDKARVRIECELRVRKSTLRG